MRVDDLVRTERYFCALLLSLLLDEAFAGIRRDVERHMALRPEFGHVICIGMGHDGRGRGELGGRAERC